MTSNTASSVNKDKESEFECADCKCDIMHDPKDYYMMKDELWKKHGVGLGMLCMGCFEKRLGRRVKWLDLEFCPLNVYLNPYTQRILLAPWMHRLGRGSLNQKNNGKNTRGSKHKARRPGLR